MYAHVYLNVQGRVRVCVCVCLRVQYRYVSNHALYRARGSGRVPVVRSCVYVCLYI
jgi:hypothetical protein